MRRRVTRKINRHFGVTAKRVTVQSKQAWYWRASLPVSMLVLGYLLAYLQLAGGDFSQMMTNLNLATYENRMLHVKVVQKQRQLQVEEAAQSSLSEELKRLQDETIQLKADLAFYKNILEARHSNSPSKK